MDFRTCKSLGPERRHQSKEWNHKEISNNVRLITSYRRRHEIYIISWNLCEMFRFDFYRFLVLVKPLPTTCFTEISSSALFRTLIIISRDSLVSSLHFPYFFLAPFIPYEHRCYSRYCCHPTASQDLFTKFADAFRFIVAWGLLLPFTTHSASSDFSCTFLSLFLTNM